MDREILRQIEMLNRNLSTVVMNQTMLYCLIKEMNDKMQGEKGSG